MCRSNSTTLRGDKTWLLAIFAQGLFGIERGRCWIEYALKLSLHGALALIRAVLVAHKEMKKTTRWLAEVLLNGMDEFLNCHARTNGNGTRGTFYQRWARGGTRGGPGATRSDQKCLTRIQHDTASQCRSLRKRQLTSIEPQRKRRHRLETIRFSEKPEYKTGMHFAPCYCCCSSRAPDLYIYIYN